MSNKPTLARLISLLQMPFLYSLGIGLLIQPCVAAEWQVTGNLVTPRYFHSATLLKNGRVLVAGGEGLGSPTLASAELYDPARGAWRATTSMIDARLAHSATLLRTGKVLVAGGYEDTTEEAIATVELYDPRARSWTSTGDLLTARYEHTATLLRNGEGAYRGRRS